MGGSLMCFILFHVTMPSSQDQSDVVTNPFAFKMERRSGEENSDGQEMMDFSSFSSLRRYDNLEDISQIGSGPSSQPQPQPSPAQLAEEEEARIYQVATEAAGAAIAAAIEEHQRLAKIHEDENGNPPSPSDDDAPFPSCTSQAQQVSSSSSNSVVMSSAGMSGRMQMVTTTSSAGAGGGGGPEEEARSQRKALEAHISDEISKITQGMQDIVRRGAADIKPIPPPKPRRRLPEPLPEMTSSAAAASAPITVAMSAAPQAVSPSLRRSKAGGPAKGVRIVEEVDDVAHIARVSARGGDVSHHREGPGPGPAAGASASASASVTDTEASSIPRQDSAEKRKAKDLKAKPRPLLIQHIEAEEQSVSPHYRVMDSPPTPENKLIKREFSESTSVSPSSSPDMDQYMFPSPVTPPDSDSSPPKPHSPSSAGTDFDDDTLQCGSAGVDRHLAGDVSLGVGVGAGSYETLAEHSDALDFGPMEAKPSGKRVPPPVPVRSRASGAGAGVEGPRALPPPPARSESVESEGTGSEEGEASASVRDKIRAFEQVSCGP